MTNHNLSNNLGQHFYCGLYYAQFTSAATKNTVPCSIPVCPGTYIHIAACDGYYQSSCKTDTYIRLLDDSTGYLVASNDDGGSCSSNGCSAISYTVPAPQGSVCRTLTLNQGCFGDTSCNANFYVEYSNTPSSIPSVMSSVQPPVIHSTTNKVTITIFFISLLIWLSSHLHMIY